MLFLIDNRFNRYRYIGTNTDTNIGIGAPLMPSHASVCSHNVQQVITKHMSTL